MVKGAESPEGRRMKETITKEERLQIRTLDFLDSLSEECSSRTTCFTCPFRMYDPEYIDRPERHYLSEVKNLCSLFRVFNGIPSTMNINRLVRLTEKGRNNEDI